MTLESISHCPFFEKQEPGHFAKHLLWVSTDKRKS